MELDKEKLFSLIQNQMRITGSEECSSSEFESDIEDAVQDIIDCLSPRLAEQEARIQEYEKILKDILLHKILDNYILERAEKALQKVEPK